MAESQAHGFQFEDMTINFIFTRQDVIDAILSWKDKNYTSIFDIPEYEHLVKFFGEGHEMLPFSKQEYIDSIKLDMPLPISIKASKKTNNEHKKVEFGDIQRTIENFSLTEVEQFSIVILEYSQNGGKKVVQNTIVTTINQDNFIHKKFCDFNQTDKPSLLNQGIHNIKKLPAGRIPTSTKKLHREILKSYIKDLEVLTSHVKIDSKKQRRVQCSIKRTDFIKSQNETDKKNNIIFNEFFVKKEIISGTRARNKKK